MSGAVNLHATALLFNGTGILIRGASRSGKSALGYSVLRRAELLGVPAFLIADDQVFAEARDNRLVAARPETIAGLIEISGVGILAEPSVAEAPVDLLVDLADPIAIGRLPETETAVLLGVALRRVVLPSKQAAFGADVLQGLLGPRVTTALTKS